MIGGLRDVELEVDASVRQMRLVTPSPGAGPSVRGGAGCASP
jgi:hypothetical protein